MEASSVTWKRFAKCRLPGTKGAVSEFETIFHGTVEREDVPQGAG